MAYSRDARQAVSRLQPARAKLFALLEQAETDEIVSVPELCEALEYSGHGYPMEFVGISCATGNEDETGLNVTNGVGFFSRPIRNRVDYITECVLLLDLKFSLQMYIQDLEWTRAWGWKKCAHEDLKTEAWIQLELAKEEGNAPHGDFHFWSDVESHAVSRGCITYDAAQAWASQPEQSRALDADIRYRLSIPKLQGMRRSEIEPSSRMRVADYAMVGEALEILHPNAIYIQSADPRTDHLLQLRRKKPLPIIHPWGKITYPRERK